MFTDQWQCFAEEIRLNHAQIGRLIRAVRRTCLQEPRPPNMVGVASRVMHLQRALEQQLDQHKCGYVEDAVSVAPRYGREAEQLRRQRSALVRRLERVSRELQGKRSDVQNRRMLAAKIADLLGDIEANQKAEARLVEAALNVDLDLNSSNSAV